MKIKELINLISSKLHMPINQSLVASVLGITRQNICNRIKNNSEVTVSELMTIEKYFNINILYENTKSDLDFISIDYYSDVFASCGMGSIIFSDNKEKLVLSKTLINNYSSKNDYSVIRARGDSMFPLICDNDKLIISHCNNNQIIDNKIYIFCYKQDFYVKRLSKNVDEVVVTSDNPLYSKRIIKDSDLNDLKLIGMVAGIIRNL